MPYKNKKTLIEEAVAAGHNADDLKKLKRNDLCDLLSNEDFNSESIERPAKYSVEWSGYILSLFESDELVEEMPTCDGLRRIFRLVIGNITSVDMGVIKTPNIQDPSATVRCEIGYQDHETGNYMMVSDVFDVNSENTPWPYCKASVATAATKAEARALRKGLGLIKVYSSEEMHQGFEAAEQSIGFSTNDDGTRAASDSAKIAITTLSNKLNIDTNKLLDFMGLKDTDMQNLTYDESHHVIALLNEFNRGEKNKGQNVPEELMSEAIF